MTTSSDSSASGLHVVLVSDGVYPWKLGGIQRHTAMLAVHLVDAGARVTLLHTAADPEARRRAGALEGFPPEQRSFIRSIMVDVPRPGRMPGHYARDCERLSDEFLSRYDDENVAADFIYAQGMTGISFAKARRLGRTDLPPVGVHPHGLEMFQAVADWRSWAGNLPMRATMRRQCRDADWVLSFPGKIRAIVERECGVPAERIIETTNAVDESWLVSDRSRPGSSRRFVFVGRHERRKGMPEILEAIEGLSGEGLEFHFVGPIPEAQRLRRADVVYHGTVTDTASLQSILDRSDVLFCPSWSEGMPTVVIEAMARGLAVIATDVGATSAWVGDDNGILLPTPNARGLRAAIERLWRMPSEDLLRLQRASLRRVPAATWNAVARATLRDIAARI